MVGRNRKRVFFTFILFFHLFFTLFAEETENKPEANQISSEKSQQSSKNDKDTPFLLKYNLIYFLKDILDDKKPFRIDFGAEPHRHGSLIFGAAYYDWTPTFSQSIKIGYDHYTVSSNATEEIKDGITNEEVRSIHLLHYPLVFYFGDGNIEATSPFTQLNLGAYFQHSVQDTNTGGFLAANKNGSSTGFIKNEIDQKTILLGPAAGFSTKIPINKYISFTTELFIVPLYYLIMDVDYTSTSHYSESYQQNSSSFSYRSISYPYLQQTLSFDFFRYIRLKTQLSYQHYDLRTVSDTGQGNQKTSLHVITFRYGGEIINPPKTRKKDSHLWAGFYYEMSWNKYYSPSGSLSDSSGKWVLCFGT